MENDWCYFFVIPSCTLVDMPYVSVRKHFINVLKPDLKSNQCYIV